MPRPNKRKAAHKQVSRDKRGKFIKEDELNLMDTESSTSELMETGLSEDSSGENFWENDQVSDWGSDVDSKFNIKVLFLHRDNFDPEFEISQAKVLYFQNKAKFALLF